MQSNVWLYLRVVKSTSCLHRPSLIMCLVLWRCGRSGVLRPTRLVAGQRRPGNLYCNSSTRLVHCQSFFWRISFADNFISKLRRYFRTERRSFVLLCCSIRVWRRVVYTVDNWRESSLMLCREVIGRSPKCRKSLKPCERPYSPEGL